MKKNGLILVVMIISAVPVFAAADPIVNFGVAGFSFDMPPVGDIVVPVSPVVSVELSLPEACDRNAAAGDSNLSHELMLKDLGDMAGVAAGEVVDMRIDFEAGTIRGIAGGDSVSLSFNDQAGVVKGIAGSNSVYLRLDRVSGRISGTAGSEVVDLRLDKISGSINGIAAGNTVSLRFNQERQALAGIAMGNSVELKLSARLQDRLDLAAAAFAACVETLLHEY